jgi:selenocysteine lyase/cysteine desulfurase
MKELTSQKHKFDLPIEVAYLNCANISPLSKKLVNLGKEAIDLRIRPYEISIQDWFDPVESVKKSFARLINCENHQRIALIPSVSYGIASVAQNIELKTGDEIMVVGEQYPSNYYSWVNIAEKYGGKIKTVDAPKTANKGEVWNEQILEAINEKTKVVALGNVHWTDGTLFNLADIREKANQYKALLIIDGSQSIGALPFDINKVRPDAVFCVGYKWLMGPFSLGLAYFGEYFDNGKPLEENWINRKDSDNFQGLVEYTSEYRPYAGRYNIGENSNFHLLPILNGALEQLEEWSPGRIQDYCYKLTYEPIAELRKSGCVIENEANRSKHLFGIRFNRPIDLKQLQHRFIENKIYASLRGEALRISVNVYNDASDMDRLVGVIKKEIVTKI